MQSSRSPSTLSRCLIRSRRSRGCGAILPRLEPRHGLRRDGTQTVFIRTSSRASRTIFTKSVSLTGMSRPDNLVIDQDFCLKIIDFDLAMQVDGDEEVNDQCGTERWIAPEFEKKVDV